MLIICQDGSCVNRSCESHNISAAMRWKFGISEWRVLTFLSGVSGLVVCSKRYRVRNTHIELVTHTKYKPAAIQLIANGWNRSISDFNFCNLVTQSNEFHFMWTNYSPWISYHSQAQNKTRQLFNFSLSTSETLSDSICCTYQFCHPVPNSNSSTSPILSLIHIQNQNQIPNIIHSLIL